MKMNGIETMELEPGLSKVFGIEVNIGIIEGVPANGACIIDVEIPALDENYCVDSNLITTSRSPSGFVVFYCYCIISHLYLQFQKHLCLPLCKLLFLLYDQLPRQLQHSLVVLSQLLSLDIIINYVRKEGTYHIDT